MATGLLAVSFYKSFEHDWSIDVGRWKFGICETHASVMSFYENEGIVIPLATIYVGPTWFDTNLSAFQVLGLFVIATLLLVAGVSFVAGRGRAGKAA